METNKPIQRFRAGQVESALWQNIVAVNGKPQTILKASVSRSYKDRNGQWRSSQSFSRSEIPLVIYALHKAFEAMVEQPAQNEIQVIEEQRVE